MRSPEDAAARSGLYAPDRSAWEAGKRLMLVQLRRELRRMAGARRRGAIMAVEVFDPAWVGAVIAAAKSLPGRGIAIERQPLPAELAEAETCRKPRARRVASCMAVIEALPRPERSTSSRRRWKEDVASQFGEALAHGTSALIVTTSAEQMLPRDILAASDGVIRLERPDHRAIAGAIRRVTGSRDVQGVTATQSAVLEPNDFWMARRPNQSPSDYVRRLALLADTRLHADRSLGLDNLPGMGAVGAWGKTVAADLRAYREGTLAWREMERGVVLEGPPGCGKTSFARALAASAGVAFISASLQQWQGAGDGHLGHLLGAMSATFDEARSRAPCVLLVDELDGVGERRRFAHHNRDYSTQVVNAFLEQLDGTTSREGVFVMGCTNDAAVVDPAILRPGRLERVIRVRLPDRVGVESILRHYLGDELADEDLRPLAASAVRQSISGASVEQWVRSARARARRAGRPLAMGNLCEEGPAQDLPTQPALLRRMALHEAGHAAAALFCGPGFLAGVSLDGDVAYGPWTETDWSRLADRTAGVTSLVIRRMLRALLAGHAAEIVCLGSPSAGAGGPASSDLAVATRIAVAAIARYGLSSEDGVLAWREPVEPGRLGGLLADSYLAVRTDRMLDRAMRDAVRLVQRLRSAVEAVCNELLRTGEMSETEVRSIVRLAMVTAATKALGYQSLSARVPPRVGATSRPEENTATTKNVP